MTTLRPHKNHDTYPHHSLMYALAQEVQNIMYVMAGITVMMEVHQPDSVPMTAREGMAEFRSAVYLEAINSAGPESHQ